MKAQQPQTIGQLWTLTREMHDITTAMLLQDTISPLRNAGKLTDATPLSGEVIAEIKRGLHSAMAMGGAATQFFAANLVAGEEARVGALNPIEAAGSYLDSILRLPSGQEEHKALLVKDLKEDALQSIPRAIEELRLSPNTPLTEDILNDIFAKADKYIAEHFRSGDQWDGKGYSNYKEPLYYRFEGHKADLVKQEIRSLLLKLDDITQGDQARDSFLRIYVLCMRARREFGVDIDDLYASAKKKAEAAGLDATSVEKEAKIIIRAGSSFYGAPYDVNTWPSTSVEGLRAHIEQQEKEIDQILAECRNTLADVQSVQPGAIDKKAIVARLQRCVASVAYLFHAKDKFYIEEEQRQARLEEYRELDRQLTDKLPNCALKNVEGFRGFTLKGIVSGTFNYCQRKGSPKPDEINFNDRELTEEIESAIDTLDQNRWGERRSDRVA